MEYKHGTDVGRVRKNNEDYYKGNIIKLDDGSEVGIFAIADGMGGHNKGEVASQLAVENIIDFFNENLVQNNASIKIEYIDDLIKQAYNTVNSLIYEKSREDISFEGMGTTLTLVIVYKNIAYIANVGDSRCYILDNKGEFKKVTTDHSIVEEYVKANIITEKEARVHPDRNKITRAVGTEPVVIVDIFKVDVESGNKILLATDGLTGAVDKEMIEEVLVGDVDAENIVKNLIVLANDASGKDNVTVIIVLV